MTTYTAEDFAKASFARHPNGDIAARFGHDRRPWHTDDETGLSDGEMAVDGWVPVREATDQPITLDALHEAWETAEDVDECNAGDILIRHRPGSLTTLVQIWRSEMTVPTGNLTRILHRAPKPKCPEGDERLEALIDEWRDLKRVKAVTPSLSDWLAEHGVHVSEVGEENDE